MKITLELNLEAWHLLREQKEKKTIAISKDTSLDNGTHL